MFIQNLSFENYRNLQNSSLSPGENINIICGNNAQGKTNLIECMWLLTGGRSFRGAKDRELISFDQKFARVKAAFFSTNREQTVEILIQNNKRTPFLNGVQKNYLSEIIGSFCAVIFSPNHLTLVKNGPDERRNFIDSALCQIKPSYAMFLSRYRKILNQRNALLKAIQQHPSLSDTLDAWNERLAEEGSLIAFHRYAYMKEFSKLSSQFYQGISNNAETLETACRTGYSSTSDMPREELKNCILNALRHKQEEEISLGYTVKGVHRDDMTIRINSKDAKSYASQGQQRSAVLSMKLAEAALLQKSKGEPPVILLDDVLSELDSQRQNYLIHRLDGFQVFITCCDTNISAQNKFLIQNGKIIRTE